MTEILEGNKFGQVQISDINRFETHNNISLPNDYKDFLIRNNGGRPNPNLVPSVKSDVQWIYGMVDQPYYASIFSI